MILYGTNVATPAGSLPVEALHEGEIISAGQFVRGPSGQPVFSWATRAIASLNAVPGAGQPAVSIGAAPVGGIIVTPETLFFSVDPSDLIRARQLNVGIQIFAADGSVATVAAISHVQFDMPYRGISMFQTPRSISTDGHFLNFNGFLVADYAIEQGWAG